MSKILRVNMATCEIKSEEVPEKYQGLGGRAITANILKVGGFVDPLVKTGQV